MAEREVTLDACPHPRYLALGNKLAMVRVDDPVLRPIFFGAPDLGWEGDHRLAVYSYPRRSTFVLARLEHDDEYRVVKFIDSTKPFTPASVNQLCRFLVAHDVRRGFDPHAHVIGSQELAEAEWERKAAEWEDDMAERLAWSYKRDRGTHLGGSRFVYPSADVPKEPTPRAS